MCNTPFFFIFTNLFYFIYTPPDSQFTGFSPYIILPYITDFSVKYRALYRQHFFFFYFTTNLKYRDKLSFKKKTISSYALLDFWLLKHTYK